MLNRNGYKNLTSLQKYAQFSREVRTRTPIRVRISDKEKAKDSQQDVKSNSSRNNGPSLTVTESSRRSKFSRFNREQSENITGVLEQMQFKNPQEITKELSERFKQDGVDVDEEFIKRMVQQSAKEQETIRGYIDDPKSTLSKVNEDEINKYIDWIIEDGSNRINRQQSDMYKQKIDIREKLNEFMMDSQTEETPNPESLTKAFTMAQEMSILNSDSSLDKLSIFLKHLSKLTNVELQRSVSLQKYAALYELSTQLLDSYHRDLCIYLCGKLLYDALVREYGPRARPDPINEKFFIESCIKYDDLDRALDLYESRKDKDVKDERFWFELGVSIYLAKYSAIDSSGLEYLDKATDSLHEIRNRWGYVSNLVLIDGLKRCCVKENFDDAWWFWEEIELNIDDLGIVPEIKIPETKLYAENEQDKVFKYYNRIESISYGALLECIFPFISGLEFEKSMEILTKIVTVDKEFVYEFVKQFGIQFKYSGREMFLINLEQDAKLESCKYLPEIRDYLIDEIKPLQKTRCVSYEEAKIIEDINVYLERLSKLKGKQLTKINDIQEIIQSGEKLTSFDVKSLLNILLEHKSKTSFQLAGRIIGQMNEHKSNNTLKSVLPVASSYAYTEFCKQFLSQSNPRVNEINHFLTMMAQYDIKLDQALANKIITSYISKKLFTEAIKFIEEYVFTDNPIAVNQIKLGKPGTKNLYTTVLLAYYKSVVSGCIERDAFNSRLSSLRIFIQHIMLHRVDDEFILQETIGTLLAFGDYQGSICLVQWFGEVLNKRCISFDCVLAVKSKLELSILKAEKYLKRQNKGHRYESRIEQYRRQFGIQSLHHDLKSKRDFTWQEVAMVLYNYADLFGYKSTYAKEDPFSMLLSDSERNANKIAFEKDLAIQQQLYSLPKWVPTH